jgi:DNA primase
MVWLREAQAGGFDTPESRAQLEATLKQVVSVIADENVRRHYGQDVRDRLNQFFQGASRQQNGQRNFDRNQRQGANRNGGPGRGGQPGARMSERSGISDRLARSSLVSGHQALPPLRESVLALTIVNHPQLLFEEYDEISAIEYDNRDLQRFWSSVLNAAAAKGPRLSREILIEQLEAEGFDALLKSLDQQIRFARLWTATTAAAPEDAREGYLQALALHQRTKALLWQRRELESELAYATEEGDDDTVSQILRNLQEVQLEVTRLENQEAIVDGFGVLSGRVKGPAGK